MNFDKIIASVKIIFQNYYFKANKNLDTLEKLTETKYAIYSNTLLSALNDLGFIFTSHDKNIINKALKEFQEKIEGLTLDLTRELVNFYHTSILEKFSDKEKEKKANFKTQIALEIKILGLQPKTTQLNISEKILAYEKLLKKLKTHKDKI